MSSQGNKKNTVYGLEYYNIFLDVCGLTIELYFQNRDIFNMSNI